MKQVGNQQAGKNQMQAFIVNRIGMAPRDKQVPAADS